MPTGEQSALIPVVLDGPAGQLFGIYYPPARSGGKGTALYIPPFAEEMNRSRRMAALQARAFAAAGIGAFVLDLFGTGDSGGDFRDARMSLWLDDIAAAVDWLDRQGAGPVSLWGLRFGALLACMAAANRPGRFTRLLLWQPVTDGKAMLTQFLRIRVAGGIGGDGGGETTKELREQLAAGRSIEVAGYELSGEFAEELESARIEEPGVAARCPIDWLEVAGEAADQLLPAGQRIVDRWREKGITVAARSVAGDPFWSLQEVTVAPNLVAATMRATEGA